MLCSEAEFRALTSGTASIAEAEEQLRNARQKRDRVHATLKEHIAAHGCL
jgi:hypothetical protein